MDDGSGGDSGGSGQQLGAVDVDSGWRMALASSPRLAKMADGCVNRNITNMRKFGFSEYVCESRKIR